MTGNAMKMAVRSGEWDGDSGTPWLCLLVGGCVRRCQWGRLCPACPLAGRKGWKSWGCPQHSVQEADLSPGEAEGLGGPKDRETEGVRSKCCDLTGAQASGQVKLSGLVALWCISCGWGQSILCVLLLGEKLGESNSFS